MRNHLVIILLATVSSALQPLRSIGANIPKLSPINRVVSAQVINNHRLIAVDRQDAEASFKLGVIKYDLGERNAAMEAFDKAIEINPSYAKAYFNRGILKFDIHLYTEAIRDYSKAIEIDPKYAEAYYHRGIANFHEKQKLAAINDYNRAIEIKPDYARAYYHRSLARYSWGEKSGAVDDTRIAGQLGFKQGDIDLGTKMAIQLRKWTKERGY